MSGNEIRRQRSSAGGSTVSVVGGGQLARMMQEAANALGIELRALVEAADGSAAQVIPHSVVGAAKDEAALRALADGADVLTVEHEHLDHDQLRRLENSGVRVRPGPDALIFAQDKLSMRRRLGELGIPVPEWAEVRDAAGLEDFGTRFGWPVVVKTSRGGYDGKGVRLAHSSDDVSDWLESLADGRLSIDGLGGEGGDSLLAEEYVPFTRELAALVARRPSGEVRPWPVVETVQVDGVCTEVLAPAPDLAPETAARAQLMAEAIATGLGVTGVLAVELFCVEGPTDRIVVNELAMRPHNSGHWSIEGAVTSQFEQHLRAVLDLPLGDTTERAPACVMVNLLGSALEDPRDAYSEVMERFPAAKIHLYGKERRPGRKLGHVTVWGESMDRARQTANSAVALLRGDERETAH